MLTDTLIEPGRITLLGELRVERGGRVVTRFRTQKTGALLAFLALRPGARHSREELIERFWPDAAPEAGRMSLRTVLSSLRGDLGDEAIQADRQFVALDPQAFETDVLQLERALRRAQRATEPAARVEALRELAARYTGPLLPGFYESWVLQERDRLHLQLIKALDELIGLLEREGALDEARELGVRLVDLDPVREESHVALMRLYARQGNRTAILRQYHLLERTLDERLGAAPSPETAERYHQLLQERPTPAVAPAPTPAPAAPVPTGLPVPLTALFGRDDECERLVGLLESVRLVTLTGLGGAGKTRIAIAVGHALAARGDLRVLFVPLVDTDSVPGLLRAIHRAVRPEGSSEGGDLDPLAQALADRPTALILDNFEQLVDLGGGERIAALLERAPTLRCLVTSRQRLDIGGEREVPVNPLPVPSLPAAPAQLERFASAQLFVDRGRAVRPDFAITRENAAALSALCERLEGIPLAIELAAAWVSVLTPAQILSRIGQRFTLLTGQRKDLPLRHRTLRSAVEWSYGSLSEEERRFFCQLSVFRGGWTLEASEAVCAEPMAVVHLAELGERSLVRSEEEGAQLRFRMLETLREFGREHLSAEDAVALSRRHARHYLSLAIQAGPGLHSPDQQRFLELVEADHDNIRLALQWAIDNRSEGALVVGACHHLFRFWDIRGYIGEARRWLGEALRLFGEEGDDYDVSLAHYYAGCAALIQGDPDPAERHLSIMLERMRARNDMGGVINTMLRLALVARVRDDREGSETLLREGLTLAREHGRMASEINISKGLAELLRERNELDEALELSERALTLSYQHGDPHGLSMILGELGILSVIRGDYARAEALLLQNLEMARQLKAVSHEGSIQAYRAWGAALQGDWARAEELYRESLAQYRRLEPDINIAHNLVRVAFTRLERADMPPPIDEVLEAFGRYTTGAPADWLSANLRCAALSLAAVGEPEMGARLFGTAEALYTPAAPIPPRFWGPHWFEKGRLALRERLGADRYEQLRAEGAALQVEDAAAAFRSIVS